MRCLMIAVLLLCLTACNRSQATADETTSASALTKPVRSASLENSPEVADAFGILLEARLPSLTDESDDEAEDRKRKRRPPPAPLEWKILPANVLSNYYLLEPSSGPIMWRGIVIGYRKRETLIDGSIIETWYQDSNLTAPLQGVRFVTTSATGKDGTRQIKVSMTSDAWDTQYVISVPKSGPFGIVGSTKADGKTTTVTVRPNDPGASKPFHVHYTDSSGGSADADVAPRLRNTRPATPTQGSPAPKPPSKADATAQQAAEAERARKALESADKAREQIEQLRKTQDAIRQMEAARRAAEQLEAARKAAEQAAAARRALEQLEAARRAAEAARQRPVPIFPH